MSQLQVLPGVGLADVVLVASLGIAAATDLRNRRIPNWLSFGAALLGLLINGALLGLDGVRLSLTGWGLGVALLVVPFVLRGMSAGDVKLLAAVGALKGPSFVLTSFVAAAIVGGIIALALLIWHRRLRVTLLSLALLQPLPRLGHGGHSIGFAYGVALAMGSLGALAMGAA